MTTYTAIPNGDIDQDSPITQPLMTAIRDNPIAISEGEVGAPRIMPKALGLFIAIASLNTTGTTFTNLTCLSMLIFTGSTSGATAATLQVRFSNDNGATFGAWQNIIPFIGSGIAGEFGGFATYLDIGATPEFVTTVGKITSTTSSADGSLTHPGGVINAIGLRVSTGASTARVKLFGFASTD